MLRKLTTKEVSSRTRVILGSQADQPWAAARGVRSLLGLHVHARRTHDLLLKSGFEPSLVRWQTIIEGTPADLRCNTPGWDTRVVFRKLLAGVSYTGPRGVVLYCPSDGPGWVYKGCVQGCGQRIQMDHPYHPRDLPELVNVSK